MIFQLSLRRTFSIKSIRRTIHIPGGDFLQSTKMKNSFEDSIVLSYTLGRKIREGRFGNIVNIVKSPFHNTDKLVMKIQDGKQFPKVVNNETSIYKSLLPYYNDLKNLVTMPKAIFHENNLTYFVLKKYNRADLFDILMTREKLCETEAKSIFTGLLNIVGKLHNLGIVHRDIKPENILFQPSDPYYIT